jgi:hypothetical protein
MVSIRRLSAVLGVLAVLFAAHAAKAENFRGTFTLPIEVHWGGATLPPGEYTFNLDTAQFHSIATIRGEKQAVMVMPNRGVEKARTGSSVLILTRVGNQGFVRQLRLVEAGLAYNYAPAGPKGRLIAQGPELIQRIPVVLMASAK